MPQFLLNFNVNGITQTITRTDKIEVRAGDKNYWYALFNFLDDTFDGLDGLSATFSRDRFTNVANAKIVPLNLVSETANEKIVRTAICQIPWEVMTSRGTMFVGLFAGDMLVTNEVKVQVALGAPALGSESQPTQGWYEKFQGLLEDFSEEINISAYRTAADQDIIDEAQNVAIQSITEIPLEEIYEIINS